MSKTLSNKLTKVREDHYAEALDQVEHRVNAEERERAIEFRGALKSVEYMTRNLGSQLMAGLIRVEEEKLYIHWGFSNFADYLSSDECPGMGKTAFYAAKQLYLNEGPNVYDLFSGVKIPAKARRLLAEKNIEIKLEDSELVIGDQRVPVADTSAVKELFNTVYDALRERDVREEVKDKKIEKLEDQLKKGKADYDELRRATEDNSERTPYERALLAVVASMIALSDEIKAADAADITSRSEEDLKLVAGQYFRLSEAYGINVPLADVTAIGDNDPIKAIASGDWDMD